MAPLASPVISRAALRVLSCALAGALLVGCTSEPPGAAPSAASASASASAPASVPLPAPASAPEGPSRAPEQPFATDRYPWLQDRTLKYPEAVEPLTARFAPPPGFSRVPVAPSSFGAWLRGLPLAAPGAPVLTYKGSVLLPGDHENIAAVVSIDIGQADLQQCADSVIRLHAEWRWWKGERDMTYRAASGAMMPLSRWMRGERPAEEDGSLVWSPRARPDPEGGDHASFRRYLDSVFAWANTGGLAKQAAAIPLAEARPGDFVVLPGTPGHAVLILDMAIASDGRRVALLGQSFMPAQSFQVLRPDKGRVWFELDAASPGLKTPFWPIFPWSSLRRLDAP